jgi:hypothetical protein
MTTVILGFGTTEKEYEHTVINAISSWLVDALRESEDGFITEEKKKEIELYVGNLGKESRIESEKHDKEDTPPARYSSFYSTCTFGVCDVVIVLKFYHINRQHPFSPDGWALLVEKNFVHVSTTDLPSCSPTE